MTPVIDLDIICLGFRYISMDARNYISEINKCADIGVKDNMEIHNIKDGNTVIIQKEIILIGNSKEKRVD